MPKKKPAAPHKIEKTQRKERFKKTKTIVDRAEKKLKTEHRLETRGQRMCRFIETYCRVPEGMLVGKPLRLDDFQKKFILDVYDNPHVSHKGILSIGRKNAKTALIACIVLGHLVGPEAKQNSEIISGAQSREQASKVFNYAMKMVRLNPELAKIVKIIPSQKKLVGLVMNVTYQAISADAKTAMGGSPILAILDEVGQIQGPQDDFVDAIETSQGAHDEPLLLAISTQAANDNDLLSVWIDDARRSKDPHIICHVYEAPKGCDVMDEKAWHLANPALGKFRSLEDMKKMAKKAARMPSFENAFRNLYLNQRVSAVASFVTSTTWESCGDEPLPLEQCDYIVGGLDLSERFDLTALVLLGFKDGRAHAHCYFWTPEKGLKDRAKRDRAPYELWVKQGFLRTTPGASVDYEFVATEIAEIIDGTSLRALAYDRWRIKYFQKELDLLGLELPLKECGQGYKDMGVAVDELESLLLNALLNHNMHPVLTMCAAHAKVIKDPAGSRKLCKVKSTGRIDGMTALAMAAFIAKVVRDDDGNIDDFINDPLIARVS